MSDFTPFLQKTASGSPLSEDEMVLAMTLIMEGRVAQEEIAQFLTRLARRGETADEITGAAHVMRAKAATIEAPANTIDCCGTGGDGHGTYNISTAVAFVAAACGIPVAKHGNRAASSRSGAADVLEELGVNLAVSPSRAEEALRRFNFTFLMAPNHHQAMKHVVPVRRQLGFRTIFNLLGPLANPANTQRQLIGVFSADWTVPLAEALYRLGTERAWIVHGEDGLDEITVTGKTRITRLENGITETLTVTPADFGLPVHKIEELKGGDAAVNAAALRELLEGRRSAYRDIVLANAAAVLVIGGKADILREAAALAASAIDTGGALEVLEKYRAFSQKKAAA